MPREELLDRLCRADGLILPFYDEYTLAMKFFEYVGSGKADHRLRGARPRRGHARSERHNLGVTVRDRDGFADVLRRLIEAPESFPGTCRRGSPRVPARAHSIAKLDELLSAAGSAWEPSPTSSLPGGGAPGPSVRAATLRRARRRRASRRTGARRRPELTTGRLRR